MDRYQRVEKRRTETLINENEIRITTQGRMRNHITYAITPFQEKGSSGVVLKAMGRAINKTLMIGELIKRRIVCLHQNTRIVSTYIPDTWEPLEEGLVHLETTRHVSAITITLSKKELDTSSPGYQPPIPADQMKPWTEYDYEGGSYSNGVFEYSGDIGREGGRGRGYSGGDSQQDLVSYNEYGASGSMPAPSRGHGRGHGLVRGGGRGPGHGLVRGRDRPVQAAA